MSTGIQIETTGFDAVQALTERMIMQPHLPQIGALLGALVESQVRLRIQTEKRGPDGEAWVPWSAHYEVTRHGGQSLLMSEGHLRDSITFSVNGEMVEVGSNLVYAASHQFGRRVISGGGIGRIPARPFLGLSEGDSASLEATVQEFITGLINGEA